MQNEFYLCMNCAKMFDENPIECKDEAGAVHSRFSDRYDCYRKEGGVYRKTSDITDWIFKFCLGADDSLDTIPHFISETPEYALTKAGFMRFASFQFAGADKRQEKTVKGDIAAYIGLLNKGRREYLVFSVTSLPDIIFYAFMERIELPGIDCTKIPTL